MVAKGSVNTAVEERGVPGWPGTEGQQIWWLIDEPSAGSAHGILALVEVAPGHEEPLHRHPNCEHATYVHKGSGVHLTPGEQR